MVYVGQMFNCLPYASKTWRYKEACHLLADTVEELHATARVLKLKRSWFQSKNGVPHYDLTESMRKRAIKEGAQEIDFRAEGKLIRAWRLGENAKRPE